MVVQRRYLVWDEALGLTELPRRAFDLADDGVVPIPGLAGRCVKLVSVLLVGEGEGRSRVADLDFSRLYFDAAGYVDAGRRDRMIRLMLESCADRRGRADAECAGTAGYARGRLAAEYGWEPPPAVLAAVLHRVDCPLAAGLDRRLGGTGGGQALRLNGAFMADPARRPTLH